MINFKHIMIYVTCNKQETAKNLANIAVSSKLAACCNIIGEGDSNSKITSIYSWKGKIEEEKEILCVFKTRYSLFEEFKKIIEENHDYDTPEIIATPIICGNKAYLDWIDENTKDLEE